MFHYGTYYWIAMIFGGLATPPGTCIDRQWSSYFRKQMFLHCKAHWRRRSCSVQSSRIDETKPRDRKVRQWDIPNLLGGLHEACMIELMLWKCQS
jgi:hypothetical protein